MGAIAKTDLILNADGSAYHLNLLPEDIADTIITVGDPERVEKVSKQFDNVEISKSHREFVTNTGYIGRKRLTVISTGIGTDNIDIVINELDALVNVDRDSREPYSARKKLNIIRIGTSGALQANTPVDSLLASSHAIGLDGLMHYYLREPSAKEKNILTKFRSVIPESKELNPYIASADTELLYKLAKDVKRGITVTAPGFYGPQGRTLRIPLSHPELLDQIMAADIDGLKITNLEMETAGIYSLAACLGHRALSFNVILANRATDKFSKDPERIVEHYIMELLEAICTL